ncbi:MAG: DUF805 domain-containing protein [Mesorhizobium sp.]
MTASIDAMRHYATFSGRATRSQFWLFTLVYFVILVVAFLIDQGIDPTGEARWAAGIVSLVHFIPSLAIWVRRLRDINRSGWWLLIAFVPLVGLIVLIVFACTASQPAMAGTPSPTGWPNGNAIPRGTTNCGPDASSLDRLEKLSALRASGALSDEEFATMKNQIMGKDRQ